MHYLRLDRLGHFWASRDTGGLCCACFLRSGASYCLYDGVTVLAVMLFFIAPVCLASSIQVSNAWVNQAPPGANSAAAYLSILNTTVADIELLQLSSPAFQRVEIHRTILVDGIAKMRKKTSIKIAANTHFELKPGGYHLMLIGPRVDLAAVKAIKLELHLSGGEKKTVLMPIRRITSLDIP